MEGGGRLRSVPEAEVERKVRRILDQGLFLFEEVVELT
jgi:hypothetical protein